MSRCVRAKRGAGAGCSWAGRLLVVLMGVCSLAGCAGSEQYGVGRKLLAAGDYDRAIESFRQAVAQDPGNTDYRMGLAEAQSLAADQHVEQAEKLLGQHQATAALRELRIAMDQVPAHPRGILLIKTVEKETQRCEALLPPARAAMEKGDWAEAARLAGAAYQADQSHPEVKRIRDEARAAAVTHYLAQAKQALDGGDWASCAAACAEIKAVDPANADAAGLERKAADRGEALRLLESAKPLVSRADYLGAIAPLQRAASLWPENQEITTESDRVAKLALEGAVAVADSALAAGHFAEAVDAIDRALALAPSREDLAQRRKQALDRWAEAVVGAYERYAIAGAYELAWRAVVEAIVLSPDRAGWSQQACSDAEQAIRRTMGYGLSVLPLASSTAGMNETSAVCRMLLDELQRVAPGHVRLAAPAGPSVTSQQGVLPADITDAARLEAMSRQLGGVDYFIFVEVAAGQRDGRPTSRNPADRARPVGGVTVHLRLVESATGRVLFGDDKIAASSLDRLRPLLQSGAAELLACHAAIYRSAAQGVAGDQAAVDYVRFLFDSSTRPEPQVLDSAWEGIFSPHLAGERLTRSKQVALERLELQWSAPRPPRPDEALALRERPAPIPATSPSPDQPRTVAGAEPAPRTPLPAAPPPKPPQPAPAPQPVAPPPPPQDRTPAENEGDDSTPPTVFRGTVSRDDDRYPKELETIDGIVVKVKDTDGHPLDADLEIRVDKHVKRYEDQPVGARISGRGRSGRFYQVIVLAIEDDQETVHFVVQAAGSKPPTTSR